MRGCKDANDIDRCTAVPTSWALMAGYIPTASVMFGAMRVVFFCCCCTVWWLTSSILIGYPIGSWFDLDWELNFCKWLCQRRWRWRQRLKGSVGSPNRCIQQLFWWVVELEALSVLYQEVVLAVAWLVALRTSIERFRLRKCWSFQAGLILCLWKSSKS